MLFATAKADLYFDGAASKSVDRRSAPGIGVAAAIVASALTYLAENPPDSGASDRGKGRTITPVYEFVALCGGLYRKTG